MANTVVPFELFGPDYFRNPYTALDWLRVNSPVHRYVFPLGNVPMWVVTRYDDAMTILGDTRFSTAEWRGSPEFQASGLSISAGTVLAQTIPGLDPPQHTKVRRCAMTAFTPETSTDGGRTSGASSTGPSTAGRRGRSATWSRSSPRWSRRR